MKGTRVCLCACGEGGRGNAFIRIGYCTNTCLFCVIFYECSLSFSLSAIVIYFTVLHFVSHFLFISNSISLSRFIILPVFFFCWCFLLPSLSFPHSSVSNSLPFLHPLFPFPSPLSITSPLFRSLLLNARLPSLPSRLHFHSRNWTEISWKRCNWSKGETITLWWKYVTRTRTHWYSNYYASPIALPGTNYMNAPVSFYWPSCVLGACQVNVKVEKHPLFK